MQEVCIAAGPGWECRIPVRVRSKQLCGGHSRQQIGGQHFRPIKQRGTPKEIRECASPNCQRTAQGRKYCGVHLARLRKGMDMEEYVPLRSEKKPPRDTCKICGDSGVSHLPRSLGRNGRCRGCHALWQREVVGLYGITRRRAAQLRDRYRLSVEKFEAIFQGQGEKCAGCESTSSGSAGRHWTVDHDHSCCQGVVSCGKCVRGILCFNCNLVLGNARDSSETLLRLVNYLERSA